jgi:hypothetical protein
VAGKKASDYNGLSAFGASARLRRHKTSTRNPFCGIMSKSLFPVAFSND